MSDDERGAGDSSSAAETDADDTTAGNPTGSSDLSEPTGNRDGERSAGGTADDGVGSAVEDAERRTVADYVTGRRRLSSRVRIQWLVWVGATSLVLGLVVGGIARFLLATDALVGVAAGGVAFVLGVVWVVLRYRLWRYEVRTDSLYLERGVVTHVRTVVPFVRIQHVDSRRSPLDRALGLSRIVVYTAGSRGADVAIPGLTPDESRDLQDRIKELAIEAEGDDAV